MAFRIATLSDVGIKRKVNQDSLRYAVAETGRGHAFMAVVCDGMGGLAEGEVASSKVADSFVQWFHEHFLLMAENDIKEQELQRELTELVLTQNQELIAYGKSKGIQAGTTVSAIFIANHKYYTVHVGDSRIYGLTDRMLLLLTNDHSVVAEEVRQGILTEEQAQQDRRRNILTQCVGVRQQVVPEFADGAIEGSVSFLLCSDGFVHKISGKEIFQFCNPKICNRTPKMKQTIAEMVELLKNRKETDNISVVLLRVDRKKGGIIE